MERARSVELFERAPTVGKCVLRRCTGSLASPIPMPFQDGGKCNIRDPSARLLYPQHNEIRYAFFQSRAIGTNESIAPISTKARTAYALCNGGQLVGQS